MGLKLILNVSTGTDKSKVIVHVPNELNLHLIFIDFVLILSKLKMNHKFGKCICMNVLGEKVFPTNSSRVPSFPRL